MKVLAFGCRVELFLLYFIDVGGKVPFIPLKTYIFVRVCYCIDVEGRGYGVSPKHVNVIIF
jgi:hypothetical protein